jgi:hypothetical protein
VERGICKLCLLEKDLVESHLVPKAVYPYCRAGDLDPVMIRHDVILPTQRQIYWHLLCEECEDVLNKGGESWVVPLLAEQMGKYPLFDLLDLRALHASDRELSVYHAAKIPAIKTDKLVHLAMGIFFKASVHSFQKTVSKPMIDLGQIQSPIRQFLRRAGPFPPDTVLMLSLTPSPVKYACFTVPIQTKNEYAKQYFFYLPGLRFTLVTGPRTREAKMVCLHATPEKIIFVEDLSQEIKKWFELGSKGARRTKKFFEYADAVKEIKRLGRSR